MFLENFDKIAPSPRRKKEGGRSFYKWSGDFRSLLSSAFGGTEQAAVRNRPCEGIKTNLFPELKGKRKSLLHTEMSTRNRMGKIYPFPTQLGLSKCATPRLRANPPLREYSLAEVRCEGL